MGGQVSPILNKCRYGVGRWYSALFHLHFPVPAQSRESVDEFWGRYMVSHWNACRRQITKASGARLEFSLALVVVAVEGWEGGGDGARVVGGRGVGQGVGEGGGAM